MAVDVIFWAALALLALMVFRLKLPILDKIESRFSRFSQKQALCVLLVTLLAPLLRFAMLPWVPIQEPHIHDEFSYILLGETLAAGRLTNPSHPMAVHFETMHVNQWPTYQSMYPPAQGVFLGIGEVAFGHPWYGVVLSVALMCGATIWMLQGWLPPSYALLGGLFCIFRYATFSYWTNTYFGGAVAALAGALFFGALGRIRKRPTAALSALLAFALLLLANSRPYEGFMTSVAGCVAALFWIVRDPLPRREKLMQFWLPAGLVLVVGVCAMLFYNWRGTGHPLMMPYQANFQKYRITNVFLWQKLRPIPTYTHFIMRKFYIYSELHGYLIAHTQGMWQFIQEKIEFYYRIFVFPWLALFLLGFREALKNGRYRLIAISVAISLLGILVVAYGPQGHYAASATCLVIALFLIGVRKLRTWRPGETAYGLAMARIAIVAAFMVLSYETAAKLVGFEEGDLETFTKTNILTERPRILTHLESLPGKHLVLIHYEFRHDVNDEWVYNRPNIDESKVVFARDMGEARNQELLDYFRDRQVWSIDADEPTPQLRGYFGKQRDHLPQAYFSSAQRALPPAKRSIAQ